MQRWVTLVERTMASTESEEKATTAGNRRRGRAYMARTDVVRRGDIHDLRIPIWNDFDDPRFTLVLLSEMTWTIFFFHLDRWQATCPIP